MSTLTGLISLSRPWSVWSGVGMSTLAGLTNLTRLVVGVGPNISNLLPRLCIGPNQQLPLRFGAFVLAVALCPG